MFVRVALRMRLPVCAPAVKRVTHTHTQYLESVLFLGIVSSSCRGSGDLQTGRLLYKNRLAPAILNFRKPLVFSSMLVCPWHRPHVSGTLVRLLLACCWLLAAGCVHAHRWVHGIFRPSSAASSPPIAFVQPASPFPSSHGCLKGAIRNYSRGSCPEQSSAPNSTRPPDAGMCTRDPAFRSLKNLGVA